ncbi:MAG TPA: hypothetical protein VG755_01280 [Nannocystaceae bacterium]|nr:hypothetical protein [Nannocystaceae bacterium]
MRHTPLIALCTVALLAACDNADTGNDEMRSAVDEIVATGAAQDVESDLLELTTIDEPDEPTRDHHGLRDRMHALIASQLPCSTITTVGEDTLVIDFGTLADECTFRDRTWAGVVTIAYATDGDAIVATHEFDGITDGKVTIDGSATVTKTDASRHIVTDFTFDGPERGFSVKSDRVQTPLADEDGVHIDGTRDFTGDRGERHVDIEGVEVRRGDSVPQAGSLAITRDDGRTLTMSFARIDDETIAVTVDGPKGERVFEVDDDDNIRDVLPHHRRR